jgi:ribose transport system substrate-binding protein
LKLSALTVAGATLAACAPTAQPAEAPAATEAAAGTEAPAAAGGKTIGVVIWSTTGTSALQVISTLEKAAKVTGVKIEVLASGYNADGQLKDVENFAAKGVNGIMICNSSEEIVAKLADVAEQNKIYFGQFFRNLTKPEIHDRVFSSPYYVGNTHEDEPGTAYILGKTIADMGIKNIAITTGPHGDSTAENRYSGLKKALDEFGVNVLAEQWDVTTGETAATACQNFISSYPELELIATMYSVEAIKAAHTAIKNAGKEGQIKIAAQDTTGDAPYDLSLLESGQAIMAGGHIVDPLFTYMMLANAVQGTPLSDKPFEAIITQIVFTPERAKIYFNQMEKGNELLGYNDEEMKQMYKGTNPNASAELLIQMAKDWSVEDFKKRRGIND